VSGGRVYLGRALVGAPASHPLITTTGNGDAAACWPYAEAGHPPGALIVGSSGGGKSNLNRVMVTRLIRLHATTGDLKLLLADGKGAHSFLMFTGQPGVAWVANAPDPQSGRPDPVPEVVRAFHAEVQRRYAEFTAAKERALYDRGPVGYHPPALLMLVLDEYMDWILGTDGKLRAEMQTRLVRCGQIQREAHCRMVLSMQAPYAKAVDAGLPGLLKMQLKARIAATGLMGLDSTESRMAFDDADAGDRIEAYADRVKTTGGTGLAGDARKGLGMIKVSRREVPFKTPPMADPLHWETTDADRQAAWALLPHRPSRAELDRLLDTRREAA
jgi:hypothetical protein